MENSELLESTYSAIDEYSKTKGITFIEAALVLNLCELTCVHTHLDWDEDRKQGEKKIEWIKET